MALCALPAVVVMNQGLAGSEVLPRLLWVWGGLTTVMALRAASIWLPWRLGVGPFAALRRRAADKQA